MLVHLYIGWIFSREGLLTTKGCELLAPLPPASAISTAAPGGIDLAFWENGCGGGGGSGGGSGDARGLETRRHRYRSIESERLHSLWLLYYRF